jgi:hypothetical protein
VLSLHPDRPGFQNRVGEVAHQLGSLSDPYGASPAVDLSTLPLNSQDIGTSRWQLGDEYLLRQPRLTKSPTHIRAISITLDVTKFTLGLWEGQDTALPLDQQPNGRPYHTPGPPPPGKQPGSGSGQIVPPIGPEP